MGMVVVVGMFGKVGAHVVHEVPGDVVLGVRGHHDCVLEGLV